MKNLMTYQQLNESKEVTSFFQKQKDDNWSWENTEKR